jgi:hypothetical protein
MDDTGVEPLKMAVATNDDILDSVAKRLSEAAENDSVSFREEAIQRWNSSTKRSAFPAPRDQEDTHACPTARGEAEGDGRGEGASCAGEDAMPHWEEQGFD